MSPVRLASGITSVVVFYGATLFVPAGTLHWPRAWILLGVTAVTTISTLYLASTSPEVLAERWKPPLQKGQPLVDKVLISLFILLYTGTVILTALDVFRLRRRPTRSRPSIRPGPH